MKKLVIPVLAGLALASLVVAENRHRQSANSSPPVEIAVASAVPEHGCCIAAPVQWESNSYIDKMSGKEINFKSTASKESLDFGFPYKGQNYGELLVAIAQPKVGTRVIFQIEKGIITGDQITVKFDNEVPQRWTYSTMQDGSREKIAINNASSFIAKIKKAKVIKIEFTAFQEGESVLTFAGMGQ